MSNEIPTGSFVEQLSNEIYMGDAKKDFDVFLLSLISSEAENSYRQIKESLLDVARSGRYSVENGQKIVEFSREAYSLKRYMSLDRKYDTVSKHKNFSFDRYTNNLIFAILPTVEIEVQNIKRSFIEKIKGRPQRRINLAKIYFDNITKSYFEKIQALALNDKVEIAVQISFYYHSGYEDNYRTDFSIILDNSFSMSKEFFDSNPKLRAVTRSEPYGHDEKTEVRSLHNLLMSYYNRNGSLRDVTIIARAKCWKFWL